MRQHITLALAMPANDRMDGVVEKATELGSSAVQPLMSERSVLRLSGERAEKKQAHWRGVAIAAAEQCGRTRIPEIGAVQSLASWLASLGPQPTGHRRWLLSPTAAQPLQVLAAAQAEASHTLVLSGPEGGLSPARGRRRPCPGLCGCAIGPAHPARRHGAAGGAGLAGLANRLSPGRA